MNKVDPSGHLVLEIIVGAIIGAVLGVGIMGCVDYQNDDKLFNGDVQWYDYVGAGLLGGIIGGLLGYLVGPGFAAFGGQTFTFGATQTVLATGEIVISGGITVTGAEIIAGSSAFVGMLVMAYKIGKSGGYRVDHHYPNDHDPIHVHISGDDIRGDHGIRVGLDGNPLPGEPKLPPGAKRAFWKLWKIIINSLRPFM